MQVLFVVLFLFIFLIALYPLYTFLGIVLLVIVLALLGKLIPPDRAHPDSLPGGRCTTCNAPWGHYSFCQLNKSSQSSGASIGTISSHIATTPAGVIYMLKAGPHYKIGKTTQFDKRLKQLKIQLPFAVEVVHKIRTNDIDRVERYWHKRFASKRQNGEWFILTEQEVNEFKANSVM